MKTRGFKKQTNNINKKLTLFKVWKWLIFFMLWIVFVSFFSIIDNIVNANKTELIKKLSYENHIQLSYTYHFPSYLSKLLLDYKNWKNIFVYDKIWIEILWNKYYYLAQILWYWEYLPTISKIINQIKFFKQDVYDVLGANWQKNYLIIFENTSEERPDWWFFWSYAKISLSWWHIVDFNIFDSYYVFWKYCSNQLKVISSTSSNNSSSSSQNNWWKNCPNKTWLNIKNKIPPYNKLFPTTTFITSNIFWFTELNWKKIIEHYNQVFPNEPINWIIFIKSDILKYILNDWEKILWKMEIINYMNKLKKTTNIKSEYIKYVKKILNNKKSIIRNFLKNYDKIINNSLIRIYLPNTSQKFQDLLKHNNLIFYQQDKFAYLFFYNLWFNKISKFIDHVIIVNDKIYLNQLDFELKKWINTIKWLNILNDDPNYYNFLEKNNVPKNSYLYSKKIIYNHILIIPNKCKILYKAKNNYTIECNF